MNDTLQRALLRHTRYAQRQLAGGRLIHPQAPHGLGGYQNWGCRCTTCTTAMRHHKRDRDSRTKGRAMTTISRACVCGGAIRVQSTIAATAEDLVSMFTQFHTGPGHAPCATRTARRNVLTDQAAR